MIDESTLLWFGYFFLLALAFTIVTFISAIIPIYILAKKTNTPKAWLAFIPIAQLYLFCKIGGKPGWWMLLMFIPIIQIFIFTFTWMGIAQVRNRPPWLGLFILVPVVNLIFPWYLALSDEKSTLTP